MSSSPTPTASPTPPTPPVRPEIKVISHSQLFYWWPVWAFGFVFALLTYVDNYRLAIIGPESRIVKANGPGERDVIKLDEKGMKRLLDESVLTAKDNEFEPQIRVSPRTWVGPLYLVIVFIVILITSIPLRGLWSLVIIILFVLIAVLLSLFDAWGTLLKAMGDLHIFINMAGYLAISVGLFVAWILAIYIFDRRTYIVFTPGQIQVVEEIGGGERVYGTAGVAFEKHRDDWFRHIILGFGTGDLTVKIPSAGHEIKMPNVAFIGFKIGAIEQMLRTQQITAR